MATLHHPPNIQWELTSECNHDCIHCYNYWRKDSEKIEHISHAKTTEGYLEIARKIVELQPVTVVLTGGEPLLVFDRVKPVIELLQEHGIIVSINTNATLLTDEICAYLKEKDIHLFISFPCAEASVCDEIVNKKGAYERILKGLDLCKKHGIRFSNNIVVSNKNLAYLEMTIDFLVKHYGNSYISVTRASKPINSDFTFDENMLFWDGIERLLEIVVKSSQKHGVTIGTACPYTPCSLTSQEAFDMYAYQKVCTAGKTSIGLDTDGNVKACPRDSTIYGNILTDDFDAIYERMHEWRDGSFVPDECKKCQELPKCLGGCRVDSIPFTGSYSEIDSISNPNAVPLRFTKKPRKLSQERKVFRFDREHARVLAEDGFYRVAHGQNYDMITPELYDFLCQNGDQITSEKLAESFGESVENAAIVIDRLLSKHILQAAE